MECLEKVQFILSCFMLLNAVDALKMQRIVPDTPSYLQPSADISYARIGDRGAEAFAAALAVSPAIKELSLRDNRLGLEGLTHILKSLLVRMGFTAAMDLFRAETPTVTSEV